MIEVAIDDDFGSSVPLILERCEQLDPAHSSLDELLDSHGAQFCAWTKAEGRPGLRFFRKDMSKNLSQVRDGKINAKDS
jgi:hypothetical protein